MRLLNTATCDLKEYISDTDIPKYAILSHTWGEHEVSLAQWQNRHSLPIGHEGMQGAAKIAACCEQAAAAGFEWVWVDTCCIDKSSSAELSEAINSMFRWYRNAAVCYAYLSDVPTAPWLSQEACDGVSKSRWFTRGWTLQELLAPKELIFYSQDWQPLGTKDDFAEMISSVTKIGRSFLDGESLELASIAQKMSWAAARQTTRPEDQAYCLLGIFDINMPLLYGERFKAFQRLQETLMTTYPEDHSLFAWGSIVTGFPDVPPAVLFGTKPVPWEPPKFDTTLFSILAASPADFAGSDNVVACRTASQVFYHRHSYNAQLPLLAGRGTVKLQLPWDKKTHTTYHFTGPPIAQIREVFTLMLLCQYDDPTKKSGRFFVRVCLGDTAKYSRIGSLVYIPDTGETYREAFERFQTNRFKETTLAPELRFSFQPGDIVFRRMLCSPESRTSFVGSGTPRYFDLFFLEGPGVLRTETVEQREALFYSHHFKTKAPDSEEPFSFTISMTRETCAVTGELCTKFGMFTLESASESGNGGEKGEVVPSANQGLSSSRYLPLCDSGHLMKAEGYTWVVKEEPFPVVFVGVERFPLSSSTSGGFVDAVDIVIGPHGLGSLLGQGLSA
ncbi:heterokaryon incompatibility protein-domain-containing protein [Cercophora newfieldiana]|uniref:Heterokaryon incompatibility protein-domain-containing protein n=1 Tax=Cercophora newfieldiana TaxID=92897 RepID=A0AA40CNN4_9PEZI|nr:heterokaryon incompatibility protein-domain-containing protein [Cercophora newfieldiana]